MVKHEYRYDTGINSFQIQVENLYQINTGILPMSPLRLDDTGNVGIKV